MTESMDQLMMAAREAAKASYSPYSKFRVGAAVRAGDRVFTGTNVENASYGLAICAERVAIFSAVAAGARRIDAVAVTCIDASEGSPPNGLMPCGSCRQVMAEFGSPDMPVGIDRVGVMTLDQLMPLAFRLT